MPELDRRNMLAALLPTCKLINGAPIEERDAAERWYLRKCQGQGDTCNARYNTKLGNSFYRLFLLFLKEFLLFL